MAVPTQMPATLSAARREGTSMRVRQSSVRVTTGVEVDGVAEAERAGHRRPDGHEVGAGEGQRHALAMLELHPAQADHRHAHDRREQEAEARESHRVVEMKLLEDAAVDDDERRADEQVDGAVQRGHRAPSSLALVRDSDAVAPRGRRQLLRVVDERIVLVALPRDELQRLHFCWR
eukprot:scaffold11585_cov63-Phaeocystis_antarctica.AAC.3